MKKNSARVNYNRAGVEKNNVRVSMRRVRVEHNRVRVEKNKLGEGGKNRVRQGGKKQGGWEKTWRGWKRNTQPAGIPQQIMTNNKARATITFACCTSLEPSNP